jgi:hypothetical protein
VNQVIAVLLSPAEHPPFLDASLAARPQPDTPGRFEVMEKKKLLAGARAWPQRQTPLKPVFSVI